MWNPNLEDQLASNKQYPRRGLLLKPQSCLLFVPFVRREPEQESHLSQYRRPNWYHSKSYILEDPLPKNETLHRNFNSLRGATVSSKCSIADICFLSIQCNHTNIKSTFLWCICYMLGKLGLQFTRIGVGYNALQTLFHLFPNASSVNGKRPETTLHSDICVRVLVWWILCRLPNKMTKHENTIARLLNANYNFSRLALPMTNTSRKIQKKRLLHLLNMERRNLGQQKDFH